MLMIPSLLDNASDTHSHTRIWSLSFYQKDAATSPAGSPIDAIKSHEISSSAQKELQQRTCAALEEEVLTCIFMYLFKDYICLALTCWLPISV
jgi:hypothetical protein